MRKLLCFLLSAAMCASLLTVPVSAAAAEDEALAAAALNMMGAIRGDGSGSLGLTGTLTRAQFCKIAVVVMGLSNKVSQYSGYTIFPDVPSSGWAAGYVNLAVRQAGILTGYPNGAFGPDDYITYGQAVTVLMKMLGYTTADVGAVWPDGFIGKADEIGLTKGVTLNAASSLTKGGAAILFLNLLNAPMNGSDKAFMETIQGATVVSGVFLVSSNAETDGGEAGAVLTAGARSGTYLPAGAVPDALIGAYGALVLNSAGRALTFVPAAGGKTVVSTVSYAASGYIGCADGTEIAMTSSAAFYLNGEAVPYGSAWMDIDGGMLVSARYGDGGALQCVLAADTGWGGAVTVAAGDAYALPPDASVFINGNPASAGDIEKYDVVADNGSGIYSVTRRRVTGRLEDTAANAGSACTVTLLGTVFELLDGAADELADLQTGDAVTLLLTSDNKAAGIVPAPALCQANYGVVTSLSSAAVTVRLACGMTITGNLGDAADVVKGGLVSVVSGDGGTLDVYAVGASPSSSSLDVSAGRLGAASLSKALTVYECVGGGAVGEIGLSDIPADTVAASKIRFVSYGAAGSVELLVLDDVTGDRYAYGIIGSGTEKIVTDGMAADYNTTSVTNGNGKTTVHGGTGFRDGDFAGVAVTLEGELAGYAPLTAVAGVSRNAFEQDSGGGYSVETGGGMIPVASDVQAYIAASGQWTTLARVRAYSDNLTVYYDRTVGEGGKVRVVVAP